MTATPQSKLLDALQDMLNVGTRGIGTLTGLHGGTLACTRDNPGDGDEMLVIKRTPLTVRVEDQAHVTKSILGTKSEKIPHYVVEVASYDPGDYNTPPDCDVSEAFAVPCRELARAAEEIVVYALTLAIRQTIDNETEARYWAEQKRRDDAGETEQVWS